MKTFNEFGQPVGDALIDWQPRPHPSRVVLQGRFCRLEPLRVAHAEALFSAYSLAEDTRSWTWLLREPDATAAEYAEWVASVSDLSEKRRRGGGSRSFLAPVEPHANVDRSAIPADAVRV